MNRPLSATEVSELSSAIKTTTMSRRQKLFRWASIVRAAPQRFVIWSNLENMPPQMLNELHHPGTAFTAAFHDTILRDAGLANPTVGEAMRFFELTRADLHEFSCDCGGEITNEDMAHRIEAIALGRAGHSYRGVFGGVMSYPARAMSGLRGLRS